jgi:acetate---CoA ligase (ADP-forming)
VVIVSATDLPAGASGRDWDQALLAPRELVLFGASSNPQRLSSQLIARIDAHGYAGAVHLVNPRGGAIGGQTVYRSITELHVGIDLALIMVPAQAVPPVLRECAHMGVGAAVVFTTGANRQIIAESRGQVRVLGPNSQGLVSAGAGLAATFSHAARPVSHARSGSTAVVSQSGAVAGVLWDSLRTSGIDLAYWVTTGNEADLDVVDVGSQLGRYDAVEQVVFYVEGLRRGPEFLGMLEGLREAGKQAVILGSGRSELGKAAATTHTASAAGDFEIMRHLCEDRGAVVLSRVEDVVSLSQVRKYRRRPASSALRAAGVAIVSSSGGFGAMLVDALHDAGLPIARLGEDTTADLRRMLPEGGSAVNPVDLTAGFLEGQQISATGDGTLWTLAGRRVAADPTATVIALIVSMVTGDVAVALTKEIRRLADEVDVPVCVAWLGGDLTEEYRRLLRVEGVPVYQTLAALVSAVRWLSRDDRIEATPPWERRAEDSIDDPVALELLAAGGVRAPRWSLAKSADEAACLAREYGGRVVLKGVLKGVLHKARLGLVETCDNAEQARAGFERVWGRMTKIDGVAAAILVQEFVPHDAEVLVGIKRDRVFGTMLVLGAGGVSAGARTVVHIARVGGDFSARSEVDSAIAEGAVPDLPAAARTGLVDMVGRLAGLMADHPEFEELEINPVGIEVARPGAVALDIVVRTR